MADGILSTANSQASGTTKPLTVDDIARAFDVARDRLSPGCQHLIPASLHRTRLCQGFTETRCRYCGRVCQL